MKTIVTSSFALLLVGLVSQVDGQDAQSPPTSSATTRFVETWYPQTSPPPTRTVRVSNQPSEVVVAIDQLKKAETEGDRKDAEANLKDALGKEYDQRLDAYAKYLDDLEAKLDAMKSKLEKRRDAKSEMVRLRVEVIKAESNDLGWPDSNSNPALYLRGSRSSSQFPTRWRAPFDDRKQSGLTTRYEKVQRPTRPQLSQPPISGQRSNAAERN